MTKKETDYPSPTEREQIIRRRNALFEKLLPLSLKGIPDKQNKQLSHLVQQYGRAEVDFILNKSQALAEAYDLIGEQAMLYREYRQAFARFGGDRPFLNRADYERLMLEFTGLAAKRQFKSILPFLGKKPGARERELYELLLVQVDYWEDIMPPAIPPRPAGFVSPQPGSYSPPAQALLTWGWPSKEIHLTANAHISDEWRSAIPELAQIVFDEGLLEGWPGEAASWAPYHALHTLGVLQAQEHAERLLALLERENDWLSDRLPAVWGQMGSPAEPTLRAYLDDRDREAKKRGCVMMGLKAIAETYPKRRGDIIKDMTRRLQHASAGDAAANGYLVYVLNRMNAVEASEAIRNAFTQKKVDPKIIRAKSVHFLEGR